MYDIIIADDIMNFLDGSDMIEILRHITETKLGRYKIQENVLNKILICSSDSDHVKSKIKSAVNNVKVSEKPLNLELLKKLIKAIFRIKDFRVRPLLLRIYSIFFYISYVNFKILKLNIL